MSAFLEKEFKVITMKQSAFVIGSNKTNDVHLINKNIFCGYYTPGIVLDSREMVVS